MVRLLRRGAAAGRATRVRLLLNPVGRAAWVGLFATALNLLPAGQLDGGHIVYSVAREKHARISLAVIVALVPLALLMERLAGVGGVAADPRLSSSRRCWIAGNRWTRSAAPGPWWRC